MTWKEIILDLFSTGVFSTTAKLMMVFYYWFLGGINDDEATDLFEECDFTFTKPTSTGATVLTNGTTSYTIVSLITAYHDNDSSKSRIAPYQITDAIDDLYSNGLITGSEQTTLKGLGW